MRPEKKSIADELRAKLKDSTFIILADHKGLSVSKTTDLRKRLRVANARLQVIKNRVVRHVGKELGQEGLSPSLKGPSAMIFGRGDVVQAAKILKDFCKENDKPIIKSGTLNGSVLSRTDVESLAALPAREVLLAQVVGTIAAPMSQLVGVLQQKTASVVYALQAAADKKAQA